MADRWFYSHGGQVRGPVSVEELRRLLAAGQVLPGDDAWEETVPGAPASVVCRAADVLSVTPPPLPIPTGLPPLPQQPPAPRAATTALKPDWLPDIAQAEGAVSAGEEFEWLAEVEIPPASAPAPGKGASPSAAAGPCRVTVGGVTSRGCVRERNEDRFLIQQMAWSDGDASHELALLVVADGMGGHQGGEKASSLAVRTMAAALGPVMAGFLQGPSREAGTAVLTRHLERAFQEAHAAICRRGETDAACKGMGSTAAAAIVWDDQSFAGHVGDCRVYHLSGGQLRQVTRDHSVVARLVELGQLTEAEAATHPARNEVMQGLGKRGRVEPSRHTLKLAPGDKLILACDGLAAHVETATLAETAAGWTGTAAGLAQRLVELANEGGGSDNCTVLVALCQ
jgi:serine/threonine protein phosphatase PrpC